MPPPPPPVPPELGGGSSSYLSYLNMGGGGSLAATERQRHSQSSDSGYGGVSPTGSQNLIRNHPGHTLIDIRSEMTNAIQCVSTLLYDIFPRFIYNFPIFRQSFKKERLVFVNKLTSFICELFCLMLTLLIDKKYRKSIMYLYLNRGKRTSEHYFKLGIMGGI